MIEVWFSKTFPIKWDNLRVYFRVRHKGVPAYHGTPKILWGTKKKIDKYHSSTPVLSCMRTWFYLIIPFYTWIQFKRWHLPKSITLFCITHFLNFNSNKNTAILPRIEGLIIYKSRLLLLLKENLWQTRIINKVYHGATYWHFLRFESRIQVTRVSQYLLNAFSTNYHFSWKKRVITSIYYSSISICLITNYTSMPLIYLNRIFYLNYSKCLNPWL